MCQSEKRISNKNLEALRKDLDQFLNANGEIYAKSLRRKVSLEKLPEVILKRKSTRKKRLQCFHVAMDILRKSANCTQRMNNSKQKEYEISGLDADGKNITIHLREEVGNHKNKRTYFISCYFK